MPAVQRLFIAVILLLTLAFSVRQDVLPALSAARPVIDTDNPVYSHLQNRILISGAGFQAFSVYHLWLKKPNEGNTSYTGVFFVATGTGSVPYPDVSIILGVQPILGTYLLTASVSSDIDTGGGHMSLWYCWNSEGGLPTKRNSKIRWGRSPPRINSQN